MNKTLLFAGLLALASCRRADPAPTIDFGAGDGITHRNGNGVPTGAQDPTDWTLDTTWNEQECSLFPGLAFDLNGPQRPSYIIGTYLYPNPGTQVRWVLAVPYAVYITIEAVLVSREYRVLKRFPATLFTDGNTGAASGYRLDLTQADLAASETCRLYYLCYDDYGLVYKGHGDLRYGQ